MRCGDLITLNLTILRVMELIYWITHISAVSVRRQISFSRVVNVILVSFARCFLIDYKTPKNGNYKKREFVLIFIGSVTS